MSDTSALPKTCPQCGTALPADATDGLCPRCLMAEAMQASQVAADAMPDTGAATIPVAGPTPSVPRPATPDLPLPEELTALLPHGMYRVEGFLGQGGMGAVYKGMQIRLKRPVAIKIMRRDFGRDYDFEARFEREAQAMAKLNHPNIVGVIDYGEAGPDFLYIVMELVNGADLMDVIRTGRMTQEMALTLLPQICDALQFAHDHGIVHRDIKPSNIMLTRDGRVKMADFGLAKHFDAESSFRTQTGTGMGTPDYAAPEQFNANAQIDHRADIYALGVMIYQMITGELPRGVWKPPSQRAPVVPEWDDIVAHAMQSDPADRYQQASEVKTDVSKITPGAPPVAGVSDPGRLAKKPAAPPPASLMPATTKSRAPLLFGLITGAVVIAVSAFFALRDTGDGRAAGPPAASGGGLQPPSKTADTKPASQNASPPGSAPQTPAPAVQNTPLLAQPLRESGWKPLFTDAEWRAPAGPGREFRDGWLHLTAQTMLKPRQLTRDSVIRTKVRIGPGLASPAIVLRDGAAEWRLELVADTQGKPVEFRLVKGTTGSAAPPTTVVSDKRETVFKSMTGTVVIEMSISGSGLTAWARGQATQAGVRTVGAQFSKVSEWGISATDAWFESVEVQPLPAAATPAPIAAPALPALPESGWKPLVSKEEWETNWEGAPFNYGGKLVLPNRRFNKEGLLHMQSTSLYKPSPSPDGAIRVESVIRQLPHVINLGVRRRSGDQGRYAFGMGKDGNSLLMRYITTDATTWGTLQSCPLPAPLKIGDRLKLELRIQGSQITGLCNGVAVLQAQDQRLTAAGEWGLDVVDASIKSVEVQSLPAAATPIAAPALPESGWKPLVSQTEWQKYSKGATDYHGKQVTSLREFKDGLLHMTSSTLNSTQASSDGAIRARLVMRAGSDGGLVTARASAKGRYSFGMSGKGTMVALSHYPAGGSSMEELVRYRFPKPLQPDEKFTIELRLQGDQLIGLFNGQEVVRATDKRLKEAGKWGIDASDAWFESVEVQPLPAAAPPAPIAAPALPESGWEPLFTETEWKAKPGFKNGQLNLSHARATKPQPWSDGAMRARIEYRDGSKSPSLVARQTQSSGGFYYRLGVGSDGKHIYLSHMDPKAEGNYDILGRGYFPAPLKLGDKLLLELRAQGGRLTGLLNGKVIIEAQDTRLQAPGEWGIIADEGWFESVEVQPLPAANEQWRDGLLNEAKLTLSSNVQQTSEGLRFTGIGSAMLSTTSISGRDVAVRMRASFGTASPKLTARQNRQGDKYMLYATGASLIRLESWNETAKRGTLIRELALKSPLQPGQDYELELRIVGQNLTAKLNSEVLGTATDGTLSDGLFGVIVGEGKSFPVLVKSLKFLDLTASAKVSPSPNLPVSQSSAAAGIKLWDMPEKLPKQKGVSWENGAVRVDNTVIGTDSPAARDLVFRASMKFGTDNGGGAHLLVRHQEKKHSYALALNGKVIELRLTQGGNVRVLKSWPAPEKYQPDDWLRLEVRAIGPQLTVSVADQVLGTVEDSTLMAAGGVSVGTVRTGYFRDIEYVPLDAPAVSSSPNLPVSQSSSAVGIKLWDTPEKLPKQQGVSWENGSLRLDNAALEYGDKKSRDAILRVSVLMSADNAGGANILIRHHRTRSYYALTCVFDKDPAKPMVELRTKDSAPNYRVLASWPMPRAYRPDEWARFEFHAEGDQFTALMDGQTLGSFRESTVQEPGGMGLSANRTAHFRDIEYVPLDAPAVSLSPNLPVSKSSAAVEPWIDVLRDPAKLQIGTGAQRTPDGILLSPNTSAVIEQAPRDGAIRARASYDPRKPFKVHGRYDPKWTYILQATDAKTILLGSWAVGAGLITTLAEFPLPQPLRVGQDYELELRIVGQTLTARLDGKVLGTATDAKWATGDFRVSRAWVTGAPTDSVLIKSLEVLDLDTPAKSSSSPSSATKAAPFTNTLGMKFVPVPGTKALFGIWPTRVQDYAAFAKAQEAAGKKVDGSWKTLNKDGVPVGREADHPVVSVSWEDAQAFCAWLTERETAAGTLPKGAKYRLPTDAEWSTAVGLPPEPGATPEEKDGKNNVDFPWGKGYPPKEKVGNYADESFHAKFPKPDAKDPVKIPNKWITGYDDGYATTSPVGAFPANAHGLYDMGGNVRQWCDDWWNTDHQNRVLRGACFYSGNYADLISSHRNWPTPESRGASFGFRCVLEPAPSTAAVSPSPNLPVSKSSDPKFPPGQWVKLFTKPEDLPEDLRKPGSVVKWEDGWVRFDRNASGRPRIDLPSGVPGVTNYAIRVRGIRSKDEISQTAIVLRKHETKFQQYQLSPKGVFLTINRRDGEEYPEIMRFSKPIVQSGAEYVMEFGIVGSQLVARYNDDFMRVQDTTFKQGSAYLSGKDDLSNIEVINLDGLPETEALRLLGVDEQGKDLRWKTGAAEAWIDVLRDPSIVTLTKGAEFTPEGLRLPAGSGAYVARGKSLRGDVAMRVRTTFGGARLQLRSRSDGRGFYSLTVVDDKSVAIQRFDVAADKSTHLRTFTLPSPLKAGQDYEMEFRCVGPALTASLNGELLGTITDGTHTEGSCTLSAWETSQTTALAKAFYILDLSKASRSAASSSSIATATKDALFTNTLGMKFVPVPITGGSTDKQRVLFSVWETRVQDYEVFVKETKREWPTAEFPQGPTHPAVMVSWEDAAAFCAWLTEKERKAGKLGAGEVYRLPSDHEWSCAVGIGTREDAAKLPAEKTQIQGVYPWGTPWPAPADAANVWSDELNPLVDAYKLNRPGEPPPRQDGHAFTAPVGSYTPSSLALHDLGGNVREWTADWYDGSRKQRVARGGAWAAADHGNLLSSLRMHFLTPNQQAKDIGFRVVLAPAGP